MSARVYVQARTHVRNEGVCVCAIGTYQVQFSEEGFGRALMQVCMEGARELLPPFPHHGKESVLKRKCKHYFHSTFQNVLNRCLLLPDSLSFSSSYKLPKYFFLSPHTFCPPFALPLSHIDSALPAARFSIRESGSSQTQSSSSLLSLPPRWMSSRVCEA